MLADSSWPLATLGSQALTPIARAVLAPELTVSETVLSCRHDDVHERLKIARLARLGG